MADISVLGSVAYAVDDSAPSVTANHTLTGSAGGREIYAIVAQGWFDAGDMCDSVKYNGVDMTLVYTAPSTNTLYRALTVWRLLEVLFPVNGTYNVVAAFGEAVTGVESIFVFTLQECGQASLEDVDLYSSGGATVATYNMTTLTDGAAVLTATLHDGLGSFTHGTDQAEIFDQQVNKPTQITVTASIETIAAAGSATQTDTYSGGSDKMCGVSWVVKKRKAPSSGFFHQT